jgi:hypothetical protein
VTITETTIAEVAGLRIGVGNVWDAEFVGPDGQPARGPTAMVSFSDAAGQDLHRERVHAGSELLVGGRRYRIDAVHAPASGLGSVTLTATEAPAGGNP